MTTETIVAVRSGRGMDLTRYVERTFRDDQAAIAWRNRQVRTVTILRVSGKWRANDRLPFGIGEPFERRYAR